MKRTYGLVFFAFALALWATTSAASAQATRTWVSGVGDDANPCSRTAPCKTFAGAISKTAPGGEIDALDPGGFGGLTITKAITIDGGGGQVASVLVAGTPGITVSAGPADIVTIRNVAIQGIAGAGTGGTYGINFTSGLVLNVEHCFIDAFAQYGIAFQPSVRAWLNVSDSTFNDNTLGGIYSSTTATTGGVNRVSLIDSNFFNSPTGFGIEAGQNTDMHVAGGLISGNYVGGAIASGVSATLQLQNSTLTNNRQYGVHATSSGIVRMSGTAVSFTNGTGLVADSGGQIISWGTNQVAGNTTDGSPTSTIGNI